MFRQGQLAVHGLAILLGRNEAGISNRGKKFLHHTVVTKCRRITGVETNFPLHFRIRGKMNAVHLHSTARSLIDGWLMKKYWWRRSWSPFRMCGLYQGYTLHRRYSDPPEMENLPGAASHGRKLRKSKGRALEASTVQYCDKWGYILIQVGATSWDSCTKLLFNIEGYNFLLRGISLRSTIRKLELHGFLWSGCPLLNFISKKSKIKKLYGS